jgi:hypothetical protein
MNKLRSLTALFLLPIIFAITGCVSQTTLAGLVQTLGATAESVATIEGNSALAAQLQKDVSAASTAVLNWKTGTPVTEVVEALNLVEDDLNLFPVSTQDVAFIDLGIVTVDGILELLPQSATTSVVSHSAVAHRHVVLIDAKTGKKVKAPKSSAEFDKLKAEISAKTVLTEEVK